MECYESCLNTSKLYEEYLPTFKVLLKQFKAKSIKIEEKDTTKMSKEEFFAMVDKARAGKKTKASKQELLDMLK